MKIAQKALMILLTVALLSACSQSQTPQEEVQFNLRTVNNLALPATLIDAIYQDPGAPAYRFQMLVTGGVFRLNGYRYQQLVGFHDVAEGYPERHWTWSDFGNCTPLANKWICESAYYQNYRFELVRQTNGVAVKQDFTEAAMQATYYFGR